jgi:NADPH:quinone reductase-like Zn-dependent oxidoreductase
VTVVETWTSNSGGPPVRAIVYNQYGSPEQLSLQDVDRPHPGEGEVLVRVAASSINSWDWDLLQGAFQGRMGFMAPRKPRHRILGADVAGTVEAVGPGATRFQPGDEVFGDVSSCHWGAFADYMTADEEALAPILDVTAVRSVGAYRRALAPGGVCGVVGGRTGTMLQAITLGSLLSLVGSRKIKLVVHRPDGDDVAELGRLMEGRELQPVIDRVYSLEETPDAFRYFGTGLVTGKVVITT